MLTTQFQYSYFSGTKWKIRDEDGLFDQEGLLNEDAVWRDTLGADPEWTRGTEFEDESEDEDDAGDATGNPPGPFTWHNTGGLWQPDVEMFTFPEAQNNVQWILPTFANDDDDEDDDILVEPQAEESDGEDSDPDDNDG